MSATGGKKAFLTGGGGYVGSRLAQYLEERGYEVAVADVKFTDASPEANPNRLRVEVGVHREHVCTAPVNLNTPLSLDLLARDRTVDCFCLSVLHMLH